MSTTTETAPGSAKGCRTVLKWLAAVVLLGAVIGGYLYWRHVKETREFLARMREDEKRTSYQSTLFPVTVNFPRGPADRDGYGSKLPWHGLQGEVADCPDTSDGGEYAEFYLVPAGAKFPNVPWVDAEHPLVKDKVERLFEVDAKELFAAAIVVEEQEFDGWKMRATLIPTPHGGVKTPENLTPEMLARLSNEDVPNAPKYEKPTADPRHTRSKTSGGMYVGEDPQAKAEKRAESEHRQRSQRYDDRHHHYYIIEAVKDFGEGRLVALRRTGQVFGEESVSRAFSVVQKMADEVRGLETP